MGKAVLFFVLIALWTLYGQVQDQDIAKLNMILATIPALMGYSPACWQNGLNVMMEKVLGTLVWKNC